MPRRYRFQAHKPAFRTRGAAAIGLALLLAPTAASGDSSRLWGDHGETWDAAGRLPDFSYAGYHAGEIPWSNVPVVANVKDYGAVGDGLTDATAAFQEAILAASEGALLIPAGRYLITDILRITKSRLVLRGEGSGKDGSILYITKSLSDVLGPNPSWSWSGGFLHVEPIETGLPVTTVAAGAFRGDSSLTVADAGMLSAGQLIVLRMVDDSNGGLGKHLHGGQADASSCTPMIPLTLDWPVRVQSIDGNVVNLAQPLRTDVAPSWNPEIYTSPALEQVGIEHLRIEFIPVPYAGHLAEPGYNAITFSGGVADSWAYDVSIAGADSGILMNRSKNITLREISLEGRDGHHGMSIDASSDILVEDFSIGNPLIHSVTITNHASGVVFSRGSGAAPLALDHHRRAPFENLFTEIAAYTFESGGDGCEGPHAGARNTYWNLASPMVLPLLWGYIQTNAIGELPLGDTLTDHGEWYENVAHIEPANLYEGQLSARLCKDSFDACHRGVYDRTTSSCIAEPRADGTRCDDGNSDTTEDVCSAGACRGKPADLSGSCSAGRVKDTPGGPMPWLLCLYAAVALLRAGRFRR